MSQRLLIFTDLDGTLLDHYSYSAEPALETFTELQQKNIPVIFNTSKTLAEVDQLRKELDNRHPFIVENGAGIVIPKEYFSFKSSNATEFDNYYLLSFDKHYEEILTALKELHQQYQFESFADMPIEKIAELTGLTPSDALLAKQRHFSQPLHWLDSEENKQRFIHQLAQYDLHAMQGGRFLHVMGHTDKGKSLLLLKSLYEKEWQQPCSAIALGDSANDIAMLSVADIAVVIRSPVHPVPIIENHRHAIVTQKCGPEGWAIAVNNLLKEKTTDESVKE